MIENEISYLLTLMVAIDKILTRNLHKTAHQNLEYLITLFQNIFTNGKCFLEYTFLLFVRI